MVRAIGVINWRSIFRATSCPACVKLWLAVAQIIAVPSRLWWNWWNRLSAPSGSRCVGGNLVKLAVWRACVLKFRQRSGLHDVFCFWNTWVSARSLCSCRLVSDTVHVTIPADQEIQRKFFTWRLCKTAWQREAKSRLEEWRLILDVQCIVDVMKMVGTCF